MRLPASAVPVIIVVVEVCFAPVIPITGHMQIPSYTLAIIIATARNNVSPPVVPAPVLVPGVEGRCMILLTSTTPISGLLGHADQSVRDGS